MLMAIGCSSSHKEPVSSDSQSPSESTVPAKNENKQGMDPELAEKRALARANQEKRKARKEQAVNNLPTLNVIPIAPEKKDSSETDSGVNPENKESASLPDPGTARDTEQSDAEPAEKSPVELLCQKETAKKFKQDVLKTAEVRRQNWAPFPPVDDSLCHSLGIRKIESKHIVFYTDLPSSPALDEFPIVFDAAIPEFCRYFELDEANYEQWRIEAFLMNDTERFVTLGVLQNVPEFPNGYSMNSRIWIHDNHIEYYNRFLLMHELVHAFMHATFGDLWPRWYSEGIAEYLGLHYWDGSRIDLRVIPSDPDSINGFGRLARIRSFVRDDRILTLRQIMNFEPADYVSIDTYAWSWALVLFLDNHPRYQEILRNIPWLMLTPDPNLAFETLVGKNWGTLEKDWADFLVSLDYDYQFKTTEIDYTTGTPLDPGTTKKVAVSPRQGWQNSGVYFNQGDSFEIRTSGRIQLACPEQMLPCEANGITLKYYNGHPWGQLLAVIVPDEPPSDFGEFYGMELPGLKEMTANPANAEKTTDGMEVIDRSGLCDLLFPWRDPVTPGTSWKGTADRSGTLFLRVNDSPGNIGNNRGIFHSEIKIR